MVSIRTILWGVNALLLMGLAYTASATAAHVLERQLVENTPPPLRQKLSRINRRANTRKPLADFRAILDANIFGARRSQAPLAMPTAATPDRPASAPAAVPVSDQLPIRIALTGTMLMGANSVAFVVGPDGRTEEVYRRKECLPRQPEQAPKNCSTGQAKLLKIRKSEIIVAMNGRNYIVKIGEGAPAGGGRPRAAVPRVNNAAIKFRNAAGRGVAFKTTREGNTIEMRIPSVEVEKAFENFTGIVSQARVVPYLVNGNPQGFQIRRIVPGSIFARLGLRNSDVIKTVNGDSITTADQALRLFSLFRNETEISLEIERANRPLRFNYIIE